MQATDESMRVALARIALAARMTSEGVDIGWSCCRESGIEEDAGKLDGSQLSGDPATRAPQSRPTTPDYVLRRETIDTSGYRRC